MIVWWCLACFGLGVLVGLVWAGMAGNGERMNKFKVARKATQEKRRERARRRLEAAIGATDPALWQRFAARQEGEPVVKSFTVVDAEGLPAEASV